MDRRTAVKILGGTAAGLVIGGVAGYLMAPPAGPGVTTTVTETLMGTVTQTATAQAPAAVSYWHWDTRPEDKDAITSTISLFESRNPNIKVNLDYNPWEVARQKMTASIQAGTTPDMSQGGDWPLWASMGALEPLDEYLASYGSRDVMNKAMWDGSTWGSLYGGDGHVYILPYLQCGGRCVVYNKEHFKAAGIPDPQGQQPESWDQLKEWMLTLKKAGYTPWGCTGSDGEDVLTLMSMILSWDKDAMLSKPKGSSRECGFNTPKAAEAAQFWFDLYKEGLTNKGAPTDAWKDVEYQLEAKTLSMLMMGPFTFGALDKAGIPYGVFPIPKGPERTATAYCVNGAMMFKKAKNKDACYKFIEFLNSHDGQMNMFVGHDHAALPVRRDVISDPKFSAPGSKFKPFLDIMEAADLAWNEMWDPAYGGSITKVFSLLQKGYVGDISAKEFVQGWADAWNRVITG